LVEHPALATAIAETATLGKYLNLVAFILLDCKEITKLKEISVQAQPPVSVLSSFPIAARTTVAAVLM
jgi:hypothetical protein